MKVIPPLRPSKPIKLHDIKHIEDAIPTAPVKLINIDQDGTESTFG